MVKVMEYGFLAWIVLCALPGLVRGQELTPKLAFDDQQIQYFPPGSTPAARIIIRPEPELRVLQAEPVPAVRSTRIIRIRTTDGTAEQVNTQRQAYIESLKQLQDAYCRSGQLDEALAVRNMIRQVEAQSQQAASLAPLNDTLEETNRTAIDSSAPISELRGQAGQSFYRRVTGRNDGVIWGGDKCIYTDDSDLATAAVHCGVLAPGVTAVVKFTIHPGQGTYAGSTRNDIASRDWQSWEGSYRIDGAGHELSYASQLRGTSGIVPVFVHAKGQGTVWGSSPYTDDSSIEAAAIHAGLLQPGESGLLLISPVPGDKSYTGSTRHGITSYDFPDFGGGYLLKAYERPARPLPPIHPPQRKERVHLG